MDIESKTSIYEEKEETQEVNPEEQKSEIKSEKEKDRVLQTAVIVAVVILVIGGITVARRLSNPQKDTKKGTEILKTMDEMDVSKADKKIKELETQERETEQDAEEQPASEKFADCLVLGDSITQGLYEYGVLDQANVQADRGAGVSAGDNEKLADHIARAKEMKPSVLFLSYGMNDVGAQNGDADGFIKAYRPVIRDLKKSAWNSWLIQPDPRFVSHSSAQKPFTRAGLDRISDRWPVSPAIFSWIFWFHENWILPCQTPRPYRNGIITASRAASFQ